MNERQTDFEWLRDFARRGDQQAFSNVVRRHIDLVYATAMRKAEEEGAAEEIAQNVFTALARKAWQFAPDDSLPAWLFRTTLFEASRWLRGELRRRRREQIAAELGTTMNTSDQPAALRALVPLLDEALLSLREKDRTALLLRFYESHPLREVGAALGVREDAAQKRVAGALEQVARFFQRRGFKTATIGTAMAALQHTASSAPAALAASAASAALAIAPSSLAGIPALLARLASLTRVQTAVLCLAAAAAPAVWQRNQARMADKEAAALNATLAEQREHTAGLLGETERLRASSSRLDAELVRQQQISRQLKQAATKLDELRRRVHALLTADDYRWPNDLPFVRIPKTVVPSLKPGAAVGSTGTISDWAVEVLGLTSADRQQAEQTLGDYLRAMADLVATHAYETNTPSDVLKGTQKAASKTIFIPPLGAEAQSLVAAMRGSMLQLLGAEREAPFFDGLGSLSWLSACMKMSDQPQLFTVCAGAQTPEGGFYGEFWSDSGGGGGTVPKGGLYVNLGSLPASLHQRFFDAWLRKYGLRSAPWEGGAK